MTQSEHATTSSSALAIQQAEAVAAEVVARTRTHYIPASDNILEENLGGWLDGDLDGGRYDIHDAVLAECRGVSYSTKRSPFPLAEYETVGQFLEEHVLDRISDFDPHITDKEIRYCIMSELPVEIHGVGTDIFIRQKDEIIDHVLGNGKAGFLGAFENEGDFDCAMEDALGEALADANIEFAFMDHLDSLPFRVTLARIRPAILKRIEDGEREGISPT